MFQTDNRKLHSKDVTANMLQILCKQKQGLKICHINAQSLLSKIDEFRYLFENSGIHVICISETWFRDSITDTMVSMNGYKMFRNDRDDGYGGVAIYIKSGFSSKVKSTNDRAKDEVEHLLVEVCYDSKKVLIGSVYRANKRIDLSNFYKKMEELTPLYSEVIIAGDFNSNLLTDSSLLESMKFLGFVSPNLTTPTHFTSAACTLLDLFFVSNEFKVLLYDQLAAPCFSKHDLIFLTYNIQVKPLDNIISFRNFKRVNQYLLEEEILKIDWSQLYYLSMVDEQLEFLNSHILALYDNVIPLQTKVIKSKDKPWINSRIKHLMKERDIAYLRWKKYRVNILYETYRLARKTTLREIRKAKALYYASKFEKSKSIKNTWKVIREMGIVKEKSIDNCVISDPNVLNKNFTEFPMPSADHLFYSRIENKKSTNRLFSFDCVSDFDVLRSCLSINSMATGADGIHPAFLRMLLPYLLPFLTHIFNFIITTSTYPKIWKLAKVRPIPKASSEYRPITLLPYLSKVFEKIMHKQISEYLSQYKLLTCKQSGFRAGHSCTTALVDVTEDVRKEVDEGHVVLLVLLDHSKAFDTVDHTVLLQKLEKLMHFSSTSLKLIRNYLNDREQYVQLTNHVTSTSLPVVRGVPQGSILGPLLFSIYSNDLPNQLVHCNIRMYADDVQIYISNRKENFISKLNEDLKRVATWAKVNGLSLNPKKSKCLAIHKRYQQLIQEPLVTVDNEKIEIVKKAKNLGIIFNSTLTWYDHVTTACGKTFSILRTLWPNQYCTPFQIRLLIAKTYLIPVLIYGIEIFASCDAKSKSRLNITFNNITRYVFGLKSYGNQHHITFYAKQIFGVQFDDLLKIKALIFLHKIVFTRKPEELYARLSFSRFGRNKAILPFKNKTLISNWQFFIHSIRLWNAIPSDLRAISNAIFFKKQIFQYFA